MRRKSISVSINPIGLYPWADFGHLLGLSRTTFYQWMRADRAPQPVVQLATEKGRFFKTLWRGSDILRWLEDPLDWTPAPAPDDKKPGVHS